MTIKTDNRTSDKVPQRIFKFHGSNVRHNKSPMLPYRSADVQKMIRRLFGGVGILLECTHKCIVEFVRVETHEE